MKARRRFNAEDYVPTSGQLLLAVGLVVFAAVCLFWPLRNDEDDDEPGSPDGKVADDVKAVAPKLRCAAAGCRDQADMCVWVHPGTGARSTIITADKLAAALFVYDLDGKVIQSIRADRPGSVDVRYGFRLGTNSVDIVAYNERRDSKILVYKIDPATQKLDRIDNGSIRTGQKGYCGALYRSPKTGRFFFVMTSETDDTEQYELVDDGAGKVGGKKVRSWRIGMAQAAVADDESGKLYVAEGRRGVWEVGAEPEDSTPGELIIEHGQNGLRGDLQGLAVYNLPGGGDYLIVANRRSSNFKVYQRATPHRYIGTFAVDGARGTDGLEVCNANLGTRFPRGIFVCHTQDDGRPILVTPWEAVANSVEPRLEVRTNWEGRTWITRVPPAQGGGRE